VSALKGWRQRLENLRGCHYFVFKGNPPPVRLPPRKQGFAIVEMTAADEEDIDALTRVDVWEIPKSLTLRHLAEGQRIYLAKFDGEIIGCQCIIPGGSFIDYGLQRKFTLAPDEVFYWRNFVVPGHRGKAVSPHLNQHVIHEVGTVLGKTGHITIVNCKNRTQLRIFGKMGYPLVGRVGFFQPPGFRLHYIRGREAFPGTRKRLAITRT
jgi:GNAT superfamily N-acetyltransferase